MVDPSMMGGIPPEMMGEGPPLPPGLMNGGAPPPQGPPPGLVEGASAILQEILSLADQYRQQEDDQQNLLLVEQLRTIAQKILANEQKMGDELMQGKASPQAMRRYAG